MAELVSRADWRGGMGFEIQAGDHTIIVDAPEMYGGKNEGPKPTYMLVAGLMSCTGMDVASMLEKMRVPLKKFHLETKTDVADEDPHVFKKMTLKQIAGLTGLTESFLSQMERNLSGITLSSLANVAKALDVPMRELVEQPVQLSPDTHQGKRREYAIENKNLHYERISTSFGGSSIHSLKIRIPVGYSSGFESHAGEELLYVLSGSIYYTVDQKTYHLKVGDSVHINSSRSHQIANESDTETDILWVSTFPVFDDKKNSHF